MIKQNLEIKQQVIGKLLKRKDFVSSVRRSEAQAGYLCNLNNVRIFRYTPATTIQLKPVVCYNLI